MRHGNNRDYKDESFCAAYHEWNNLFFNFSVSTFSKVKLLEKTLERVQLGKLDKTIEIETAE